MFGHERFKAYQLSIEFLELSFHLIDRIPTGHSALKDQLKRCSSSISLNIAEGTGKATKADRYRFYNIAKGSAMESAVACDIVARLNPSLEDKVNEAKGVLKQVVSILTKVCAD